MSCPPGSLKTLGAEHAFGVDGDAGAQLWAQAADGATERHCHRRQQPNRPTAESSTTHGYHLQFQENCPVRSHDVDNAVAWWERELEFVRKFLYTLDLN